MTDNNSDKPLRDSILELANGFEKLAESMENAKNAAPQKDRRDSLDYGSLGKTAAAGRDPLTAFLLQD